MVREEPPLVLQMGSCRAAHISFRLASERQKGTVLPSL
jgi:hypothetical protein